ncbi:putative phage-related endonuclease [Bacillus cereus]|nr:putative phage-related endonuclease [Bacillus cereus]
MEANVLITTEDMAHEQWLEARKSGIGGSDAAAIAGLNKWSSPIRVYYDKISETVKN